MHPKLLYCKNFEPTSVHKRKVQQQQQHQHQQKQQHLEKIATGTPIFKFVYQQVWRVRCEELNFVNLNNVRKCLKNVNLNGHVINRIFRQCTSRVIEMESAFDL